MKILTVVGARPQFVKAAVVSRAISQRVGVEEILVHTGQHYDPNMSEIFFQELQIPAPRYHLGVGSGSHGVQTGQMLASLEEVMIKEQPDVVLVYGDTNSTLAGSLAAVKLHIPVAHVEAGLRSFNRRMPEEINRVVTDHLSDLLFAPTGSAARHLVAEGIDERKILVVGDVMYDAALYYSSLTSQRKILGQVGVEAGNFVLATVHRAENTDVIERLQAILHGLVAVSKQIPVVLPLHPRTRTVIASAPIDLSSLKIIEPVGYLDMVTLEQNAALIATDSGGVQKEAFFFGVRCVTLRSETEWTELVDLGWNKLCDPKDGNEVAAAIMDMLQVQLDIGSEQPFGDGKTGEKILDLIQAWRA